MADPHCQHYRDFQMRINGLSLAGVGENVLRVLVYYFCYTPCSSYCFHLLASSYCLLPYHWMETLHGQGAWFGQSHQRNLGV